MSVPLDPGDRKLLIGAGLLLALMTLAALLVGPGPSAPGSDMDYPSSYNAEPGGAKAAYLLLTDLGYQVQRWERPLSDLPENPKNVVLVLAQPVFPASAEDRQLIRNFIAYGGRVLATGVSGAGLLPQNNMRPGAGYESGVFRAQLPGPLTRGAPEIALQPAARWGTEYAAHLGYYGDKEGAVVTSYTLGGGRVVWWAGPEPLTNTGLTQASNVILLLNSLGPPGQTQILWDEYFHGQRPGLTAYLGRTPAPWMLGQCLLLAAAVLLTYSRRHGPVRAFAVAGSRLSPLEFVETLGELYQRKGAAREALEITYQRFRFLLLRRLGLPAATTVEQLTRAVRDRPGLDDPEFTPMLQACERAIRAPALSEPGALRLIGGLHDCARRWRLGGGLEEH